jgi:hypothetical protein
MNEDKLTINQEVDNKIEAGLQLIPYIGGALATLYFGRKQQREFNRISNFYIELSEELKGLKGKLSLDNQDEAKLMTLIEKVNNKIEKEVIKEKINYFKNYFRKILVQPVKDDYDEKVFFLDSLASMSLLEIEILTFLNSRNDFIQIGVIQKPGIEQYAIFGAFGRLRNLGFLQSAGGSFSLGDKSDNYLKELVKVSPFGKEFIGFCLKV